MKKLLIALLVLASNAFAVAPTVSTAIKTGSNIAISGSNFGSKVTAAPHRFRPWTGLTNGADATGQFDATEFVGLSFSAADFTVDNSKGIGGGSLKINYHTNSPVSELFPHHEFSLPGVDYFYASYWGLIERVTNDEGGGNYFQIKTARAGQSVGGPVANYYSEPYLSTSWLTYDPTNSEPIWVEGHSVEVGGADDTFSSNANPAPAAYRDNTWHFIEVEMRWNDIGVSNALYRMSVDSIVIAESTTSQPRTSLAQTFEYVQLSAGYANDMTWNNWLAWESRHYIDTTPARVFLSDSATLAGVTGKFLLPATSWATGVINVSNAENIPVGYNYVYVANSNGEINTVGVAYTGGGSPQISSRRSLTLLQIGKRQAQ